MRLCCVLPCFKETNAKPVLSIFEIQGHLLRFISCYFLLFLSCSLILFFNLFDIRKFFVSLTGHISSVLTATLLVARFGAAAAASYDLSTTVGVAISTSFLASINDSLFCIITCCTRFSNFQRGHSLEYAVGSHAV